MESTNLQNINSISCFCDFWKKKKIKPLHAQFDFEIN